MKTKKMILSVWNVVSVVGFDGFGVFLGAVVVVAVVVLHGLGYISYPP